MAHEPQTPSRQERRKVKVESTLFLIQNSASRTIGPQSSRSTWKVSTRGLAQEFGIVAINLERLHTLRACGNRPFSSGFDPRFRRDLEVSRNGKPLEPRKARYLFRGFDDHRRSFRLSYDSPLTTYSPIDGFSSPSETSQRPASSGSVLTSNPSYLHISSMTEFSRSIWPHMLD